MKPARAGARATARGIVFGVARSDVIARRSRGNLEIASVASLPRNDSAGRKNKLSPQGGDRTNFCLKEDSRPHFLAKIPQAIHKLSCKSQLM